MDWAFLKSVGVIAVNCNHVWFRLVVARYHFLRGVSNLDFFFFLNVWAAGVDLWLRVEQEKWAWMVKMMYLTCMEKKSYSCSEGTIIVMFGKIAHFILEPKEWAAFREMS